MANETRINQTTLGSITTYYYSGKMQCDGSAVFHIKFPKPFKEIPTVVAMGCFDNEGQQLLPLSSGISTTDAAITMWRLESAHPINEWLDCNIIVSGELA